jgi:hypothetical protein
MLYCDISFISLQMNTSTDFNVTDDDDDNLKDRRRRPEGGEWEPIKISHGNLTYVPNRIRRPSLLTRSRPHIYSKAIDHRNQVRNCNRNTNRCQQDQRSTIKIGSKNSLYPHRYFTEHLVGAFEKSPRESDLNHKSSSLLIR